MKKILIIAYRFPPNNETGAFRPYSWAKYFKQLGFYPVVITRHWDVDDSTVAQMIAPSQSNTIKHEKHEDYEVYYLPFKGNLRTSLFFKIFNSPLRPIYKLSSYIERLLQLLGCRKVSMYNFMFKFTLEYLKKNNDCKHAVITGAPFELFHLGFLIKKKFKINWVADYRDPWSTRNIDINNAFLHKLTNRLEVIAETKWVKSSIGITSTSNYLSENIGEFVKRPYATILNGYMDEDKKYINSLHKKNDNVFRIVYNGNLFDFQEVELFLDAYKNFIKDYKNIMLYFIGLDYFQHASDRVRKHLQGFESYYTTTNRLGKKEYLEYQSNADCLLIVNSKIAKGIVASKVFDYILSPIPVLTVIDDNGPVKRILTDTGQFLACDSEADIVRSLKSTYINWRKNIPLDSYNQGKVELYSRRKQACALVNFVLENTNS